MGTGGIWGSGLHIYKLVSKQEVKPWEAPAFPQL